MFNSIPAGDEPGYIAFGIVDALLDLLIDKGAITRNDASQMLTTVAKRLGQDGNLLSQRSAAFITKGVPK